MIATRTNRIKNLALLSSAGLACLPCGRLVAQDTPATLPATTQASAIPAATPASAVELSARVPRVLLVPLVTIGDHASRDWVGDAVNRAIFDDLGRNESVDVVRAAARSAEVAATVTADDALGRARDGGAAFVVTGTIQATGQDLRVSGQVVATDTGRSVGGFKATGTARDLFAVEDAIGEQIGRILRIRTTPAASADATADPGPAPAGLGAVQVGVAFRGSALQQALNDPAAAPRRRNIVADEAAADRYRYETPAYAYYPYGGYYSTFSAGYYAPGYRGYSPFFGAGYGGYPYYTAYRPTVIIGSASRGSAPGGYIGSSRYDNSRGSGLVNGPINTANAAAPLQNNVAGGTRGAGSQ